MRMNLQQSRRRLACLVGAAGCSLAVLAGCGGGNSTNAGADLNPPDEAAAMRQAMTSQSALLSYLSGMTGNEVSEGVALPDVAVPASDTDEPTPLS